MKQEWDQILSKIAPEVQSSWAGVLYLNYALINPSMAYKKLRNVDLDDGQTRSYSLYLASTRPQFTRIGKNKGEVKTVACVFIQYDNVLKGTWSKKPSRETDRQQPLILLTRLSDPGY